MSKILLGNRLPSRWRCARQSSRPCLRCGSVGSPGPWWSLTSAGGLSALLRPSCHRTTFRTFSWTLFWKMPFHTSSVKLLVGLSTLSTLNTITQEMDTLLKSTPHDVITSVIRITQPLNHKEVSSGNYVFNVQTKCWYMFVFLQVSVFCIFQTRITYECPISCVGKFLMLHRISWKYYQLTIQ